LILSYGTLFTLFSLCLFLSLVLLFLGSMAIGFPSVWPARYAHLRLIADFQDHSLFLRASVSLSFYQVYFFSCIFSRSLRLPLALYPHFMPCPIVPPFIRFCFPSGMVFALLPDQRQGFLSWCAFLGRFVLPLRALTRSAHHEVLHLAAFACHRIRRLYSFHGLPVVFLFFTFFPRPGTFCLPSLFVCPRLLLICGLSF